MKTRTKRILIISLISLAAVFLAVALYLGDYYRADEGAIAVFDGAENISVSVNRDGDGEPTISQSEQISLTAGHILTLMN